MCAPSLHASSSLPCACPRWSFSIAQAAAIATSESFQRELSEREGIARPIMDHMSTVLNLTLDLLASVSLQEEGGDVATESKGDASSERGPRDDFRAMAKQVAWALAQVENPFFGATLIDTEAHGGVLNKHAESAHACGQSVGETGRMVTDVLLHLTAMRRSELETEQERH